MRVAASPEDFVVDEEPLYPATGEGAHTFVRVEKRLRNTEEVARALARLAGVRPGDVGYAGRKDRVAVARQWLSVPGLDPEQARAFEGDGFRVLEALRHPHKLRDGAAARRTASSSWCASLRRSRSSGRRRRLEELRAARPAQRVRRAALRARRPTTPRLRVRCSQRGELGRDRRAARFLLSALQAEVFNACLAARALPLDGVEAGEVAFAPRQRRELRGRGRRSASRRARRASRSARPARSSGRSCCRPRAPRAEREEAVLAAHGIPETLRLPPGLRLRGARRPIRVRPEAARCEPAGADAVRLRLHAARRQLRHRARRRALCSAGRSGRKLGRSERPARRFDHEDREERHRADRPHPAGAAEPRRRRAPAARSS